MNRIQKKLKKGLIFTVAASVAVGSLMLTPVLKNNQAYGADRQTYQDIEQFPESYREALYQLKQKHPSWTFEVYDSGLDWDVVMHNETNPAERSLIPSYFPAEYVGEKYGSGWSIATPAAVAHYMDPRNWLTEDYIFQFEQLSFNASCQGIVTVQKILANSFMSGIIQGEEYITYAQAFYNIGQQYGVSPVHLAARALQEQGTSGTSELISGTYPGYEGYYNYFNIQASGSTREEIVTNGLKEAMSEGWDTRYKAVSGGSYKVANRYILQGQDTLYLQKFDIDDKAYGRYWHQYMQNLCAPSNEGRNIKRAYEQAGMLDDNFVFKIPVYDNMPKQDGFYEDGDRTYYYKDGNMVKGEIQIEGSWYYFAQDGTMVKDVEVEVDGVTHVYDRDGVRISELGYAGGYWYVCGDDGNIQHKVSAADIFNAEDYANANADVKAVYGTNEALLLQHWLNNGIYEGRVPSALFNYSYYKSKYSDAEKYGEAPEIVAGQFVLYGMAQGRQGSDSFNPLAYMLCNEDLYGAFGLHMENYYSHYNSIGHNEGRECNASNVKYADFFMGKVLFDPQYYMEKNGDVAAVIGNDVDTLLAHWLNCGVNEGRVASRVFDLSYYEQNNNDVTAGVGSYPAALIYHFWNCGMAEGRASSPEFDMMGYMYSNKDVYDVYGDRKDMYYRHYAQFGAFENRQMFMMRDMDFSLVYDADYYWQNNKDVASVITDEDELFRHFMFWGMSEGRVASEKFDVNIYRSKNTDVGSTFNDDMKSYYLHYIRYGYAEGRECR